MRGKQFNSSRSRVLADQGIRFLPSPPPPLLVKTIAVPRLPLPAARSVSLACVNLPATATLSCTGVDFWGVLNPDWKLCKEGKRQSPVNILPESLVFDPLLGPLLVDSSRVSH